MPLDARSQTSAPLGTVYLLHFEEGIPNRPDRAARHYLGYTGDLEARLQAHRAGRGSALMAEVRRRKIDWTLARTWDDVDRTFERRLKNQRNAPRLCPTCKEVAT